MGLAREMGKQMKLSHCVNGYVESQEDLPNYGQLGCSGFIILDADHRAVSTSTSAFMEVRQLAFKHVETLLDAVRLDQAVPAVCPGEFCHLLYPPRGQERLKGEPGVCVAATADEDGEMVLTLAMVGQRSRGKTVEVPLPAVTKIGEEEEASGGDNSGGGCDTGSCGTKGSCNTGSCGTGDCNKAECAQGGCDDSAASLDDEFVASSLDLVSVEVPSMDAEHEECAAAFRELVRDRSDAALQRARDCLSEHFDHEEALFDQYGFGEHVNANLSAKKTHIEDHKRILAKIRVQLQRGQGGRVPAGFIRELLTDFHEHTSLYDVQYSKVLSAKGAA